MSKQLWASIFLIAGTAIGAGLLALPLALAKIGFVPIVLILFCTWAFMYSISLVGVELSIRKSKPFSLGLWGTASFLILFYALLSSYMDGTASIVQNISGVLFHNPLSHEMAIMGCFCLFVLTLSFMFSIIESLNSSLCFLLLGAVGFLIVSFLLKSPFVPLPFIESSCRDPKAWALIVPLVFTSFGFNAVIEPVTDLLDRDPQEIRRAFFWGSLIPLGVYLLWTVGIIYILYGGRPEVYNKMVRGGVELGELVQALSEMSNHGLVQTLIWGISLLSIVTSALGIGVSLIYLFESYGLSSRSVAPTFSGSLLSYLKHLLSVACLLLPVFLVTFFLPNAFMNTLAFAGMILVGTAILIPLYEVFISHKGALMFFRITKRKGFLIFMFLVGLLIIGCEIYNLMA